MKKNEAIKHIINKGFTKRVAGKIYQRAVENVELDVEAVDNAVKDYMSNQFNEDKED